MTEAARPTLQSVARVASVSRQTVSNVMNAPHLVRPDTIARVRSAIDELGYRPSHAARQLRTGRSRTVAMRLEPTRDGINGSVLDRFLHALVERGQEEGYRVLLFTAVDDEAEIEAYEDLLATSDLDGLVLTATHHGDPRTQWLRDRDVPMVTFGRPWGAAGQPHAWVDVDGASGTRAAVRHLRARGHRRVAFLGWPDGSGVGDDRRAGWLAGLAEADPSGDNGGTGATGGTGASGAAGDLRAAGYDVQSPDELASATAATVRLLAQPEPPTAVVCASDTLALGALGAVGHTGLTGPANSHEALAVVGFDDTPVAAAIGLTSVAQPIADAARACMEQLLAQLEPGALAPPPLLLPPHLVVRRTS